MPGQRRKNSRGTTARNAPRASRRKKREYVETPDWGTAFQREEATGSQPQYTGQGVMDPDTLEALLEADGEFQIAIWVRDSDGNLLRNRNGSRRLRIHIEPPYDDTDDDDADDDEDDEDEDEDEAPAARGRGRRAPADDDDIPF